MLIACISYVEPASCITDLSAQQRGDITSRYVTIDVGKWDFLYCVQYLVKWKGYENPTEDTWGWQKIWQAALTSCMACIVSIQTDHVAVKIYFLPLLLFNMLKIQHHYADLVESDHKGGGTVMTLSVLRAHFFNYKQNSQFNKIDYISVLSRKNKKTIKFNKT